MAQFTPKKQQGKHKTQGGHETYSYDFLGKTANVQRSDQLWTFHIIRLFEQRGLDFSYLFSADRLLNFTQTYDKHYSKISKTEITILF